MNDKIKSHVTNPNKTIIDITDNFLNDLYDRCGIDLDCDHESNLEEDHNQDRKKDN